MTLLLPAVVLGPVYLGPVYHDIRYRNTDPPWLLATVTVPVAAVRSDSSRRSRRRVEMRVPLQLPPSERALSGPKLPQDIH